MTQTVTQGTSESVTHPCSLYRCFDRDGELLYVGITSSGTNRFTGGHAHTAAWWFDVARIDVEHFPSRQEARRAERAAITTEQPRCNIAGRYTFTGMATRIGRLAPPERWLTGGEVAELLGVRREVVARYVREGMPHALLARKPRFRAAEVLEWVLGQASREEK